LLDPDLNRNADLRPGRHFVVVRFPALSRLKKGVVIFMLRRHVFVLGELAFEVVNEITIRVAFDLVLSQMLPQSL